MEPQVTLECEGTLPSGGPLMRDGDSGIAPSSPSPVGSQQPVKKQTRQWAAWTRQEEENFFNALRQVGKNFEKITWRVQSKNKDQVRHYYYRLVRRMNKLLGPGFSLDAKNSKDTNAAMLRWWSLLEKHSCTASKLHLKPRRFKIFIEALEHQLLKDRKKNTRKRPSPADNCSSSSPPDTSLQNKAAANDTRSGKLVIVDSQNIQRVAPGKGYSLKRNVNNAGTNRSNTKVDLNTMKTTRQRKKTGGSSSAAYKRWEKAAIAGVSLVADAAEHLERTKINKEVSLDEGMSDDLLPSSLISPSGDKCMHPFGNILRDLPLPTNTQNQITGASVQHMKLKLQLFPIDEATRRALEVDEHNPYLELTLSARKRISSVLEHLSRKWGNSCIASGDLMLFQYNVQRENLLGSQRWTQGTVVSAADVYTAVGSPSVFRLRYGWLSNEDLVSLTCAPPSTALHLDNDTSLNILNRKDQNADASSIPDLHAGQENEQLMESPKDQPTFAKENTDFVPSYTEFPDDGTGYIGVNSENNPPEPSGHIAISSCYKNKTKVGIIKRQWEDVENLRTSSGAPLSAGDWADSLTNISIGELLTDTCRAMETDAVEPPPPPVESSQYLQQIPFSCDSFDAAIANHIARHQGKPDLPSVQVSHAPSIWDGEETCDAFSFRKIPTLNQGSPSLSISASLETSKQIASKSSIGFSELLKELPGTQATNNPVCEGVSRRQTQATEDPVCEGDKTDDPEPDTTKSDDPVRDLGSLTDIYWPDSLGPLDLDIPSSTYRDQDLIFSDSISVSGLNRLIANSLDAFQNCSFFGLDKKEPSSSTEAHEPATVFDRKIGGEV